MATFEELKQQLSGAVRALAQMTDRQDEVILLLKERLREDNDDDVIEACIDGLVKMGVSINELAMPLSRNPYFLWLVQRYAERGYWSSNTATVFEAVIRDRWWALPAEARRSFSVSSPAFWMHWHWRYCPECLWLFYEIFDHLRHSGRCREIEWLLLRLAHHWGEPRWRFACHDFETLMGLHVRESAY